jgi:hypothetical protein
MRSFNMAIVRWVLSLAILAILIGAAFFIHHLNRSEQSEKEKEAIPRAKEPGGGGYEVWFKEALAKTYDWKEVPLAEENWVPVVPVFGRVIINPRTTVEVRAPFAGTIRADNGWPLLAGTLETGKTIGHIDLRLSPQEILDLRNKYEEASKNKAGAEEIWKNQKELLESLKASPGTVPQKDLVAAKVAEVEARTKKAIAEAAFRNFQKYFDEMGNLKKEAWSQPLVVPQSAEVTRGEIAELPVRPGMVVEAGALIARVMDFRKALVRVDVPVHATVPPPAELDVAALPPVPQPATGAVEQPRPMPTLKAKRIGIAAQHESTPQFVGYLYEVDVAEGSERTLWRPGLFVKAQLQDKDAVAVEAWKVPARAVLYHQGRALIYIHRTDSKEGAKGKLTLFSRIEVEVLGRKKEKDREFIIFTSQDFRLAKGDLVVTYNLDKLLSEEFRSDVDID